MNTTVLRVINDKGIVWDLECFTNEEFLLDISVKEAGELPDVFGITSQQFSLPSTKNNDEYFGYLWNVGATPSTSFVRSYDCQVLNNGAEVFSGKIYLDNVVTDQLGDTIYNVVVINETVDFKIQLEGLTWSQVMSGSSEWTHTYNWANINQSWDLQLPVAGTLARPGDIVYPLVEYGGNQAKLSADGASGSFSHASTPLLVDNFKPAMRVNAMLRALFNKLDYKYESNFLDSSYFDTVYHLATINEGKGAVTNSPTENTFYAKSNINEVFGGTTVAQPVTFLNQVWDNGSNWDGTNTYTVPIQGEYSFQTSLLYIVLFPQVGFTRKTKLELLINGVTDPNIQPVYWDLTNRPAGTITANWPSLQLSVGDTVTLAITNAFVGPLEDLQIMGTGASYFECYQSPQAGIGGNVDMGLNLGQEPVLEWFRGLIQKFNLVIEPVRNERNTLKIEPFHIWKDLGQDRDWTDKVDRSVKWEIKHPLQEQPKFVNFSDEEDIDEFNRYSIEVVGKVFGEYTYEADSELTNGERKIGTFFAPTPMKYINETTNFIVPQIYKVNNGETEAIKFKPRLLHYLGKYEIEQPTTYIGGWNYYVKDELNNLVTLQQYPVFHHISQLPADIDWTTDGTNDSTTLDLHFGNRNHYEYHQDYVNAKTPRDAYFEYWASYLNELYDDDARLVTMNIVIDPTEISQIQLNDKIFVDGHYYRINKINGADLTTKKSVEVQLLKTSARIFKYPKRKVFSDGSDVPDIIVIDSESSNGRVIYKNANTGDTINNYDLINQAAWKDGKAAYPTQQDATWYQLGTGVPKPGFINIGNNNIDDRTTDGIVVGGGNNVGNTTGPVVIVGEGNTTDSVVGVTVFGNNTTIQNTDGAFVVNTNGSVPYIADTTGIIALNPTEPITGSVYENRTVVGNIYLQGNYYNGYETINVGDNSLIYLTGSHVDHFHHHFTYTSSVNGTATVFIPDPTDSLYDGLQMRYTTDSTLNASKTVEMVPVSGTIDGGGTLALTTPYDGMTLMVMNGEWIVIQKKG